MYTEMECKIISGAVSVTMVSLIGHPIDTMKVLQQVKGKGAMQAALYIYKNKGILGFYQGATFPFLTNGILNAIFFGIYAPLCDALVNKRLKRLSNRSNLPLEDESDDIISELPDEALTSRSSYFRPRTIAGFSAEKSPFSDVENTRAIYSEMLIAGSVAGILQLGLLTPIELIKVKLQSQISRKRFDGPVDCFRKIYKRNGFYGLYRGGASTAIRNVLGSGINFSLFYCIVNHSLALPKSIPVHSVWHEALPLAGIAGMVSWWFVIPFDVIKSRMQADSYRNPMYRNMTHCALKIIKDHGVKGLFAGFWSASLRAFPINMAMFLAYHYLVDYC